jgi:epoxyqueuosine reductase QueG/GNAT superfamily N-acetyltransferase
MYIQGSNKMDSVTVRSATGNDLACLSRMPSYSKSDLAFPFKEEILIAERDGRILGAVSIGQREIGYVTREMQNCCAQLSEASLQKVRGSWVSKLFVFPEYRFQGIGTRLVGAAVEYLKEKGCTQVYAGIYSKNTFLKVSQQLFKDNGFEKIGSCVCQLSQGYCDGTLLKRTLESVRASVCTPTQNKHESKRLTDEIRSLALVSGAELVGFASAEEFEQGAKEGHRPSDLMPSAKGVIILACGRKLNEDRTYFYRWGPHFSLTYIRLKDETKQGRLEARRCIEAVKSHLIKSNFEVVTEPHGWSGILSFKMAAYSAGLGVFGKGEFIVNPELGPLNVIACILTDAPLKYDATLKMDVCKDCIECVKACKYGAYKQVDEHFEWIPEKCRSYDLIMNPVTLKWTYGPCNSKCVHACPIGRTS